MRPGGLEAVVHCILAALVVTWATGSWEIGAAAIWMLGAVASLLRAHYRSDS